MNPNPQTQEAALEVLTPSALESIERASIDVQVSTAHRFPRSLAVFKQRALDMVQQDLETAESCIYSRPVGKGEDGKQKYAEGASIRMAEIVAACYGNIRFGARIVEQTERYVKAEGVAHDLESNTAGKSEAMESTVKRNGQPYDERMRIVVAKACLSKALRDAIFRVVPRALCKSVYDAAVKVIAGQSKTLDQRRKLAAQWLASIRVDDARAFAVLDVKGWSEVGETHLITLTGLKTALKDQEITLLEAFPLITEASAAPGPEPKPMAPPQPPVAVAHSPAPQAGPAAPAQPETGAVCRYCNQQVGDISKHECDAMKEAVQGLAPESAPAAEPLDAIKNLAKRDGVDLSVVMAFCKRNKLAKDTQREISELADSKLKNLVAKWETIKPELLKIAGESKPAA